MTRRELRALQATGELPAAPRQGGDDHGETVPAPPAESREDASGDGSSEASQAPGDAGAPTAPGVPPATSWAPVQPDDHVTVVLPREELEAFAAVEDTVPVAGPTADDEPGTAAAGDGAPGAPDAPPAGHVDAAAEAPSDPRVPEAPAAAADVPDAWEAAVGWSLRQELPRKLPPEPEVDDVRWDPVEAGGGSRPPFPPVNPPGTAEEPDRNGPVPPLADAPAADAGTAGGTAPAGDAAPLHGDGVPAGHEQGHSAGRPRGTGDDAPTPPTGVPVVAPATETAQAAGPVPDAPDGTGEQDRGEAVAGAAGTTSAPDAARPTDPTAPTAAGAPGGGTVPTRTSGRPPAGPRWPGTPPPAPAPGPPLGASATGAGRPSAPLPPGTGATPPWPGPVMAPATPSDAPAGAAAASARQASPTPATPTPPPPPPARGSQADAPPAPAQTPAPGPQADAPAAGSPTPTSSAAQRPGDPLPTLTDLLAARPAPPEGPAESGWQGTVRRITGGIIAPAPGRTELARRAAVATVQRSLAGPKTVVVINPKGGAHKTTATMLLAATFGMHRGGYTLAWDNNETRGTLGWRSLQSDHHNTAVNLLQDLDRFSDPSSARVGDLDNYVRSQGSAQFDVLASDEDAASAASIDALAFRSLHRTLSRFYRVMVIDTGNNMRASNWQAAIEAADQVVIVSTIREDTSQSAAWAVDALRATGHEDVVRKAVTVLSAPASVRDDALAGRLHEHFGRLTRAVLDVPYDPSLVAGRPIAYDSLSPQTRDAWLHVTAAVAEGL